MKITQELIEEKVARGTELFRQGYNCSQAVAMSLCDLYDVPEDLMCRMSCSFGGGIGRMRETCGAACGMFMIASLEANPTSETNKEATYEVVQQLANHFKEETGSLICKELLGLNKKREDGTIPEIKIIPTPEPRTQEYYKKRPCIRMVETAIRVYMNYLKEKYENKNNRTFWN